MIIVFGVDEKLNGNVAFQAKSCPEPCGLTPLPLDWCLESLGEMILNSLSIVMVH